MDKNAPSSATVSAATVSVIVPAYNAARHIVECLRSVQTQDHPHWSCVVVDDGSTDNTVALVEGIGDSRIRLVRQANAGVSAARNRGLADASGDRVMFLDGDDRLHPSALGRLSAALDADPAAVAAFGTFAKILPDGRPYPGQKPLARHRYPSGDVLEAMLRGNFLANGGHVLIRTEVARAIGGFDTRLRLSEDWEFWCRLATQGPFRFIGNEPEIFALRVDPGSSSGGLSVDWANHESSLAAVMGNATIRHRFSPQQWRRLERAMRASALWEAGRVNFTVRRFRPAWRLMLAAILLDARPKRIALLLAAAGSQLTGRSWHSRLRFRSADISAAAPQKR